MIAVVRKGPCTGVSSLELFALSLHPAERRIDRQLAFVSGIFRVGDSITITIPEQELFDQFLFSGNSLTYLYAHVGKSLNLVRTYAIASACKLYVIESSSLLLFIGS